MAAAYFSSLERIGGGRAAHGRRLVAPCPPLLFLFLLLCVASPASEAFTLPAAGAGRRGTPPLSSGVITTTLTTVMRTGMHARPLLLPLSSSLSSPSLPPHHPDKRPASLLARHAAASISSSSASSSSSFSSSSSSSSSLFSTAMAATTTGTAPPSSSSPLLTRLRHTLLVLWKFTRPHTFIGTALCVPTLHLFAAPAGLTLSQILTPRLLGSILWALLPAGLINVYITGLNQITDVSIDKINKPSLPLASGQLAPVLATLTVSLSLLLGLGLGLLRSSPFFSPSLLLTLLLSAALGTAYSLPPLRLKRFPLLAALSIIAVRGTIINLGFYTHALAVAFPPSLPPSLLPSCSSSSTTLPILASLQAILGPLVPSLLPFLSSLRAAILPALSALSSLLPSLPPFLAPDLKISLASAFFMVFGMVIALMKDVPDIDGDRQNRIYSFSVRQGAARVFGLALGMTKSLLLLTGGVCFMASVNAALVAAGATAGAGAEAGGGVVAALKNGALLAGGGGRVGGRAVVGVLAWMAAVAVGRKGGKVNVEEGGGRGGEGGEVYGFYMFLWKLFYLSYALLPLAR